MALKKDSKSIYGDKEKSQNEDVPLIEFNNLENKTEIKGRISPNQSSANVGPEPAPKPIKSNNYEQMRSEQTQHKDKHKKM